MCPIVNTWMLFTHINSHQGMLCRHSRPGLCIVVLTKVTGCLLNCKFVLRRLRPSNSTRRKCLVQAVAEILWRAGEEKQATIAMYDHTFVHLSLYIQTHILITTPYLGRMEG